jgi:hypothetical protein
VIVSARASIWYVPSPSEERYMLKPRRGSTPSWPLLGAASMSVGENRLGFCAVRVFTRKCLGRVPCE